MNTPAPLRAQQDAQAGTTLRLTPEETEALRETARRERRSMQEVAREAIAAYVSSRTRRREEHLARIVAEDAELLRRLGNM